MCLVFGYGSFGYYILRIWGGTEMEQKGQIVIPLFFIVFLLELVPEGFLGISIYLQEAQQDPNVLNDVMIVSSAISGIALGLALLGGYWVGQKIDLKANLRAVILSLLVGAYLGSSGGQVATSIIIRHPESLWFRILGDLISTSFLSIVFIAFTALSLAHLRSKQLPFLQLPSGMNKEERPETEQTGQTMRLLFIVVFLLGVVVTGIIHGWNMIFYPKFLFEQGSPPSRTIRLYLRIVFSAISLLTFGLVLLGGYWVGQKIDLKSNLRATILTLLGGAYFGSWVVTVALLLTIPLTESLLSAIFFSILATSFWVLQIFFEAFTGLSLAHLRSH